jgi:hypothetical protein
MGCFLTSIDFEIFARLVTGSTGVVFTSGIVRFRAVRLVGGETSTAGRFR